MRQGISESDVNDALGSIRHPEFQNYSLVELGMVSDVRVAENRITVTLALPFPNAAIRQTLIRLVEEAIAQVETELEVRVEVTEMSPEQRRAFMALVGGDRPSSMPTKRIAHVVAVMSGKGGVGKSSVAGLLASALQRRGLHTGVLDADITGPSIPKMFGAHEQPLTGPEGMLPVESRTGIKLMSINLLLQDENQAVVWRGPLISRAIEQFWKDIAWGRLDYLVVDLPPGTSDAALTVTQSLPLDGIVLVTSPQDLAGMVVRKAASMAQQLGVPLIGLVENMSHAICPNCGCVINVFGPSRANETAGSIGTTVLGRIPLDTELAILCDTGAVEEYHSDNFETVVSSVIRFMVVREHPGESSTMRPQADPTNPS